MNNKEKTKKNAEFVLAKFSENFEIAKVSPFKEIVDEELGNDYEFSFEIVTYANEETPNKNGIPFTITVTSDDVVYSSRDDINVSIEFPLADFNDPHFFNKFFEEF